MARLYAFSFGLTPELCELIQAESDRDSLSNGQVCRKALKFYFESKKNK